VQRPELFELQSPEVQRFCHRGPECKFLFKIPTSCFQRCATGDALSLFQDMRRHCTCCALSHVAGRCLQFQPTLAAGGVALAGPANESNDNATTEDGDASKKAANDDGSQEPSFKREQQLAARLDPEKFALPALPKFVIHPDKKHLWDTTMMILLAYVAVSVPFVICFLDEQVSPGPAPCW
jgi:hypothetical protein